MSTNLKISITQPKLTIKTKAVTSVKTLNDLTLEAQSCLDLGQKVNSRRTMSKPINNNKKSTNCSGLYFIPKTPSNFRLYYERGDLPISTDGNKIRWTKNLNEVEYEFLLPLFFDGLIEQKHPYKTYVRQAINEMIDYDGERAERCIPLVINAIKNALTVKNVDVLCATLRVIQRLAECTETSGQQLVGYYKQILPMFTRYLRRNVNCGGDIDFGQKDDLNLGDTIDKTLQVLEMTGGSNAYLHIKYMVPTYESCYMHQY